MVRKKKELRLDLGCGKMVPGEGWTGVDIVDWGKHVKVIADLKKPWPWANDSVSEVFSRNLVNYLEPKDRIHFVNELHRVMISGTKALIVVPHWCSNRAYGDLTMAWPPVAEEWFPRLNKALREQHFYWEKGYHCDFDVTSGYGMHPQIRVRSVEYQQNALTFYKESAEETLVTLVKN